jgi:hypothetical protein
LPFFPRSSVTGRGYDAHAAPSAIRPSVGTLTAGLGHTAGSLSGSLLLVSTRAAGQRQPNDLAADHSALDVRRELSHLLPDRAHLRAVSAVRCEPAYLIADRSAATVPSGGLPQRRADSLGIVEALRPHEIQRRHAVIVETYVERTRHPARVARIVAAGVRRARQRDKRAGSAQADVKHKSESRGAASIASCC